MIMQGARGRRVQAVARRLAAALAGDLQAAVGEHEARTSPASSVSRQYSPRAITRPCKRMRPLFREPMSNSIAGLPQRAAAPTSDDDRGDDAADGGPGDDGPDDADR
jgi:hypothetical protein